MEREFKVGDTVTVMIAGAPYKISTVMRAAYRFLELEDGTRWQADGRGVYPRPSSYNYSVRRLEHTTKDHDRYLLRTMRWQQIQRVFEALASDIRKGGVIAVGEAIDSLYQNAYIQSQVKL